MERTVFVFDYVDSIFCLIHRVGVFGVVLVFGFLLFFGVVLLFRIVLFHFLAVNLLCFLHILVRLFLGFWLLLNDSDFTFSFCLFTHDWCVGFLLFLPTAFI